MKKDLHTVGNEYLLHGEIYIGYYNVKDDGSIWSGRIFDETSQLLTQIPTDVLEYNNVSSLTLGDDVVPFKPNPTVNDYKRGWFLRYFARKANDDSAPIYEIDEAQYNKLTSKNQGINYSLYTALNLRWKISGPKHDIVGGGSIIEYGVVDTNRRSVEFAEKYMTGINVRLVDLERFWIELNEFDRLYGKRT